MFIFKVFKAIAKLGTGIVNFFGRAADFADHLIHKKEYERRARRRKIFWTVTLSVLGGIIVVLLFPYRLIVKRNGDFEIRTLLLRVYRRSEDYDIPEGGTDGFDIEAAPEDEDAFEA